MRVTNLSAAVLILCVAFAPACSKKGEKTDAPKQVALPETGFCGWSSLTLRNAYVRFDVVPGLSGRIMGYGLLGSQFLWHDATTEGKMAGNGSAEAFNPGGAGVWFSAQDGNGGLANAVYEGAMADTVITVTSPKDGGLQFKNVYSLVSGSSLVNMTLSVTNVSDRPVSGTLRQFASVSADSGFLLSAPVKKGGWRVVSGDKGNPAWMGDADGLFHARFSRAAGEAEINADGWMAWHDATNNTALVMMLPKSAAFFGAKSGTSSAVDPNGMLPMELETRGPIVKLDPGATATFNVVWASCRCSGVRKLTEVGVVAEPLAVRDGVITGEFGVFRGGRLRAIFLNRSGDQAGRQEISEISPLSEVVIKYPISDLPTNCAVIRFFAVGSDHKTTFFLGEIAVRK